MNRVVNQVVRKAAAQGETLKLLAQPDYSLLMESLLLAEGPAQARVIHIICLEADSGQDGCRNLENVRRILRYGVGIRRYEPRYYYGKAMEHYGVMNVMPYLIVTPPLRHSDRFRQKGGYLPRGQGSGGLSGGGL